MKLPVHFYKPLAIGAPQPLRELPVRPERMIHFFPPHSEKIRAKAPETARQCDVMCGNLEDAIPIEAKDAARAGFIELLAGHDFGDTAMWVRINALNSPWVLDDLDQIIGRVGNKLDVIMIPKVEGPWDIHFVDQYVALLEAKYAIRKPILLHALLETAQGVTNVEAICAASPRMHGLSLGPADLAASRGMKTTRVGGGHPGYLNVRCKTLGQAGTLTVALKDSADDSTFATVTSKAVASADNVANATVWKVALPPGLRRFVAVSVTNGTSGTNVYNAWISAS